MDNSSQIYELIIAGAGPAGITASVYAARKKMDFLVVTLDLGGQVALSSMIENYTGFQYITGEDLTAKFHEHLKKYEFDFKIEEVQKVEREGKNFKIRTGSGPYSGKTVVIATGRKPRELNVPGEAMLKNRGVSYCATCDAPLFEGLDVAVVGGGNSGLEAVIQLEKIANSIHLLYRGPRLTADGALQEKVRFSDKVKIWANTQVKEIRGIQAVKEIEVEKEGEKIALPVQGVFIEIGSVANSDVVDFVQKNQQGEIIVNCRCETNVPGLFAAGDVTNVPQKQIVVAAGEGCKAVLQAFSYISQR
ncbi:FAD-dependent oxidoreductase [Candidatus Bathyarchaeota archaeon]|nr:FAD-dependent oxidoreductase [Candidatus Bathyarchaeota archaeon]